MLKSDEYLLHSVDEVKRFNPKAVFVPGNWVPDFFPGVKVQIFHGLGIWKKKHFNIRGFFDLYCTHGPVTTLPFQQLAQRHGFFQVKETGWPKVDALFQYKPETSWKKNHCVDKPVILYAPTFSQSFTSAPALEETIRHMSRKGGFYWLIKFHPLMDRETINAYRNLQNKNLKVVEDADIIPYLQAADIMLTDESSVAAEFLMLDKPVITFRTQTPAAHMVNITEAGVLENTIQFVLEHPGKTREAAREFINGLHPYTDGRSSERVLSATDAFVAHDGGQLKKKPMNLYRKFQVRRRLGYYRFR
jgi:CDP-glycerol glycerophosphotransferase (TagB/SpsB family)